MILEGRHITEEGRRRVEEIKIENKIGREKYDWDHLKGLEKSAQPCYLR